MSRLVEIAHIYDPEEAFCVRAYLRSAGVYCVLQNEHHLGSAPWMRVALGGYRLLVVDDEAEDAKSLIENALGAEQFSDNLAAFSRHAGVQSHRRKDILWFPIALAWGVPFLPVEKPGLDFVIRLLLFIYLGGLLAWLHIGRIAEQIALIVE